MSIRSPRPREARSSSASCRLDSTALLSNPLAIGKTACMDRAGWRVVVSYRLSSLSILSLYSTPDDRTDNREPRTDNRQPKQLPIRLLPFRVYSAEDEREIVGDAK